MQTTLYLKYRPMRVAELDLVEVREMLIKLLAGAEDGKVNKLPHAWLFSGPRGTGKTSSARILAKALNCTKKRGVEPCNGCDMCLQISAGTAMDVVEIDAASNRGIDEIRDLKEKIRLAPMQGKYKVYIIDEVHMLTTEAANALLKTLEEPPESAFFILCTTEPDKLPETVVSRCTRITFRKPSMAEGVASLMRVAEGEGMKVEKGALERLVKAAKGSFRDGTKLLEQVNLSAGEVSEKTVETVLRMATEGDAAAFARQVTEGKTDEALAMIDRLEQQGTNWRRFVEAVVEVWRVELLETAKVGTEDTVRLLTWLTEMDRVYEQMKLSVLPQLPLEMFVVGKGKQRDDSNSGNGRRAAKENREAEVPVPVTPVSDEKNKEKAVKPAAVGGGKGKYSLADLETKWAEVMKLVRPKNHSVEALLRSTRPVGFDGEKLELEVFYKFHKDKLETEKCRAIVETAVAELFSVRAVKLYLRLGEGQKKKTEEVTADGVDQDIVQAAEQIFGVEAV